MSQPPLEIPGFVYDPVRKRYFKITNASSGINDSRYSNSTVQKSKRLSSQAKSRDAKGKRKKRSNTKSQQERREGWFRPTTSSTSLELGSNAKQIPNPYTDTLERHRLRLLGFNEMYAPNPIQDIKLGMVSSEEWRSMRLFHLLGTPLSPLGPNQFERCSWEWQLTTKMRTTYDPCFRLFTEWNDDNSWSPSRQYFQQMGATYGLDELDSVFFTDTATKYTKNVVRYNAHDTNMFILLKLFGNDGFSSLTFAFAPGVPQSTKHIYIYCQRKSPDWMVVTRMRSVRGASQTLINLERTTFESNKVRDVSENRNAICCLLDSVVLVADADGQTLVNGFDCVDTKALLNNASASSSGSTSSSRNHVVLIGLGAGRELHVVYSDASIVMFNMALYAVLDAFLLGPPFVGEPEVVWYAWLDTVVIIDNISVRIVHLSALVNSVNHNITNEQDTRRNQSHAKRDMCDRNPLASGYAKLATFQRDTRLLSRTNSCYQNQKGDYLLFYEGHHEASGTSVFMLVNVRYQLMKRLEVKCDSVVSFLFVPAESTRGPRLNMLTVVDGEYAYVEGTITE